MKANPHTHPGHQPIPGKKISEKEQLAKLIKEYIVHSEKIAEGSRLTHYHDVSWITHMSAVMMLKDICRNIKDHSLGELTLFTWNALKHLEALLPVPSNISYNSSQNKLYEIKNLLQQASNKFRG